MSKPAQHRELATKSIAVSGSTITTTQPASAVISDGLSTGDEALYALNLRVRGNLNIATSSAGSLITNGQHVFLRNLRIETDKHGVLIDNIDGLALLRWCQISGLTLPADLAVTPATTGTPAFSANYYIPFALIGWLRPYDTILDMIRSRMTITMQFGIVTDFISGGTYSTEEVQVLSVDVNAKIVRNPNPVSQNVGGVDIVSEMPIMQRSIEVRKFDVTSTTTGLKFPLAFGDRIYRRIILQQRNSSTLAELSTVVTATQNVGIEINGFPWMQSVPWGSVNAMNKTEFQIETLPAGIAVIDFTDEKQIGSLLNTISQDQGTMNLVLDGTSVSNGQVWAILDCLKPIPPQARR